jgi:hypothetical protein
MNDEIDVDCTAFIDLTLSLVFCSFFVNSVIVRTFAISLWRSPLRRKHYSMYL